MPKKKKKTAVEDITRGDIPRTFKTATSAFNHTRMEEMVPMRDGVKLFTIIAIPNDAAGPMPIVLTRTPYNAASRASRNNSPDIAMALPAADEDLVRGGYIRVYQDVRGRNGSQGKYTMTMPTRGPFNSGEIDQVTDAVKVAFQDEPGFEPIAELFDEFCAMAKLETETMRRDMAIFEVWPGFVAAGEAIVEFEPAAGPSAPESLSRRKRLASRLLGEGRALVGYLAGVRTPMPKSTAQYLQSLADFSASRV